MLMMFNTVITAINIFILTLTEKDIYDYQIMENPQIFEKFTKRYYSNVVSLVKTLFFGFYSAVVVFFFGFNWFGSGIVASNGFTYDIYFF